MATENRQVGLHRQDVWRKRIPRLEVICDLSIQTILVDGCSASQRAFSQITFGACQILFCHWLSESESDERWQPKDVHWSTQFSCRL